MRNWRRSAQLLLKPVQFDRYPTFMTPPAPECTSREPEKNRLDRAAIRRGVASRVPGLRLPARRGLQSGRVRISSLRYKIIVRFELFVSRTRCSLGDAKHRPARCFAGPGPMGAVKMDPGSAARHFAPRSVRGT